MKTKPKANPSSPPRRMAGTWIDDADYRRLRMMAAAADLSIAEYIRRAIAAAMAGGR